MIWPVCRLQDICEFQNGFAFKSKLFSNDGTPILRISNIQSGSIDLKQMVYTNLSSYKENLDKYRVVDGDLLIAMSGATTGKIGINQTGLEFLLNQRVGKFLPSKHLDKKYLYYYLNTKIQEHLDISAGSAQPNLSTEQIKSIKIPLPDIPEQKRIVTILDQAFADIEQARAKTEQNLKNAQELFESYLQQVFSQEVEGWSISKLSDLSELISGQHIEAKDYNNEHKGIGYLTGPSDFGRLNPIVTKWTEHPKKTAINSDILITVKGSGIGKINLMNRDELAISRQLMAIRPTTCSVKLLYWFLSLQFKYFQSLANGAAIPGISRKDVLNLQLSIPKIEEQKLLVDKIELLSSHCTRLENIYINKLISLNELKKSILQKAFAGELSKSIA